jgi:hypothetical protein
MTTIPPSECPIGAQGAFGLLLGSARQVFPRTRWMLRTALFPFIAERGVALARILLAEEGAATGAVVESAWRGLEWAVFLPCLLAWCRIGFLGAADSPPPSPLETRGLARGLDLLVGAVLAVAVGAVAVGAMVPLSADLLVGVGFILASAGFVACGGMRLLFAVAASAVGAGEVGFSCAWRLTAPHAARLAGTGAAVLCLFLLFGQSLDALAARIGEDGGVLSGIGSGVFVALTAVCGHALGQASRRLIFA